MSIKEYLLFNISWKEINPTLCDICKFFFCLPQVMRNDDLFQVYVHDHIKTYSIYGLVCYWGGQYVCYFKHSGSLTSSYLSTPTWVFHEDKTIIQMNSWKDLIIHCMKNHYHPVMVFYRQNESRSSYFQDNSDLTERDYINMYRHCQRVDSAFSSESVMVNEDEGIPTTNKDNILYRSKLQSQISSAKGIVDDSVLKSIRNLQKMDELRKEGNNDGDMQVIEDSPVNIKGKDVIGLRPGEWQCRNISCNNVNNCSTFQCVKCKSINLKVYEVIMTNKQKKSTVKINTESKAVKYEKLDKSYNSFNVVMKKTSSKEEDVYNNTNTNTKNENGVMKGSRIRMHNPGNAMNKQRGSCYYGDEINEHIWRCASCFHLNEDNEMNYCAKCKRNKPVMISDVNGNNATINKTNSVSSNNTFVDYQEPMVNGIKHYI